MVQWLRICLPVQGTQVPSLVQEDSNARGGGQLSPQLLSPRVKTIEARVS